MGILEIIELRSITQKDFLRDFDIRALIKEREFTSRPHTIRLFTHKTLATDISIHMYYSEENEKCGDETPGAYIASLCREWGLVNLSRWQEKAFISLED